MPHKIVLIDDEPVQANHHKSELEALGFEVEFVNTQKNYDELRRKLGSADWSGVELFLLDVMMPPEPPDQRYNQQRTQDGLTTGLFVALDIRDKHKTTPIILWSTAPFTVVAAAARSSAKAIPSCAFIRKDRGVETVKDMFDYPKNVNGEGKNRGIHSNASIWKRISCHPVGPLRSDGNLMLPRHFCEVGSFHRRF